MGNNVRSSPATHSKKLGAQSGIMVDHTFVDTGAFRKIREMSLATTSVISTLSDSVRVNLGLFQTGCAMLSGIWQGTTVVRGICTSIKTR